MTHIVLHAVNFAKPPVPNNIINKCSSSYIIWLRASLHAMLCCVILRQYFGKPSRVADLCPTVNVVVTIFYTLLLSALHHNRQSDSWKNNCLVYLVLNIYCVFEIADACMNKTYVYESYCIMASCSEGGFLVLVAVDGSEFSDRALHCKYSLRSWRWFKRNLHGQISRFLWYFISVFSPYCSTITNCQRQRCMQHINALVNTALIFSLYYKGSSFCILQVIFLIYSTC
jgi:hypothetical protein